MPDKAKKLKSMQRGTPALVLDITINRDRMGESYGRGRPDLDALDALRKSGIDPAGVTPPGLPPEYGEEDDELTGEGPVVALRRAWDLRKPRERMQRK